MATGRVNKENIMNAHDITISNPDSESNSNSESVTNIHVHGTRTNIQLTIKIRQVVNMRLKRMKLTGSFNGLGLERKVYMEG